MVILASYPTVNTLRLSGPTGPTGTPIVALPSGHLHVVRSMDPCIDVPWPLISRAPLSVAQTLEKLG